MASTIDGIFNEREVNFVGKDGFFWWVGEVEDNEDPMELGRVKAVSYTHLTLPTICSV